MLGTPAIRKGVLLSRYANLLKDWLGDEWRSQPLPPPGPEPFAKPFEPTVTRDTGIIIPEPIPVPELGRWERRSAPLRVSKHYRGLFADFKDYFEQEMKELGDDTLKQEADVLGLLSQGSEGEE